MDIGRNYRFIVLLVVASLAASLLFTPSVWAQTQPTGQSRVFPNPSTFPDWKPAYSPILPCFGGRPGGKVHLSDDSSRWETSNTILHCVQARVLQPGPNFPRHLLASVGQEIIPTPTPTPSPGTPAVIPFPDTFYGIPWWLLILLLLLLLALLAWRRMPALVNTGWGRQRVRMRRRPPAHPSLAKGWANGDGDEWHFPPDRQLNIGQLLLIAAALVAAIVILILLGYIIPWWIWVIFILLLVLLGYFAWQAWEAEEVAEEGETRPFILMFPNPARRTVIPWREVWFEDHAEGGEIVPGSVRFKHGTRPNEGDLVYGTIVSVPNGWLDRSGGFNVLQLIDHLDQEHGNEADWVNPIPGIGLRPGEAAAVTYEMTIGGVTVGVRRPGHFRFNPPSR